MFNPNYTLEIISHLSQFKNKSLKQYHVDGINTIGAWGDEPFEICFKNNTWQKVQVKLSIDGTDIFTGKPADTSISDKMWVINGYGTLSLKAWPENNNGGASFVFTSANNSVALHTHGDMSSRGIIAAAVFVEGHVEPIRLNNEHHYHYHQNLPIYPVPSYPIYPITTPVSPIWYNHSFTANNAGGFNTNGVLHGGGTKGTSCSVPIAEGVSDGNVSYGAEMDSLYYQADLTPAAPSGKRDRGTKKLESLVAVGAGQHVDQKIVYVSGLIKPTFTETVRVRVLWWDDLVAALKEQHHSEPHPSGFPGDAATGINLGNTPRLPMGTTVRRAETFSYQRV